MRRAFLGGACIVKNAANCGNFTHFGMGVAGDPANVIRNLITTIYNAK